MKKHLISLSIILMMVSSPLVSIPNSSTNIEQSSDSVEQTNSKEISLNHIWSMEKNDAQRTGRSMYDTSQNKGGVKWKYFHGFTLHGTPVIDKDGIIYVGWSDFIALYPNGTLKWKIDTEQYEYQAAAIAIDGTIYVGTMKYLYAINQNGTIKWIFDKSGNFFCEPIVDSNGTIYIATQSGMIYAIYLNGTLKWELNALDFVFHIALDKNENIYFYGEYNNTLTCIDSDGKLKWVCNNLINKWGGPVIGIDRTVYLADGNDFLTAIYPNGTIKWNVKYDEYLGNPSIAHDGTIIWSGDPYVSALNPIDGSILWQYKIGEPNDIDYVSAATIGGDGTIYFAYIAYSESVAFLYALNPDGSYKWGTQLTADEYPRDYVDSPSNPIIGSDGTLYLTCSFGPSGTHIYDVGVVYAIGIENASTPKPPLINGSSMSRMFKEYEYILSCSEPAGTEVYYFIDWDDEDGLIDYAWVGPYPSEEEVTIKHLWQTWGKHLIKVRVKNSDNLCSDWTAFEVQAPLYLFFEWLFERFPNAFPILRFLLEFNH